MARKFDFKNSNGDVISGSLEEPTIGKPQAVALFAHCFSCNKNVLAASSVARGLMDRGFAVLRFDFTGLGKSEGDFANTNFSTNLDDLRAAVNALRQEGLAPEILIGHSLGGAAVLYLANEIEEVKLVASIGAPSEPAHVTHLFSPAQLEKIERDGQAEISLGGAPFTIKKQFLDDVNETALLKKLAENRKPVLVCHSPVDTIVGIDQAKKIYQAAHHPKSFVSLDGADHLLRSKSDANFVASVIATWAARYLGLDSKEVESEKPNTSNGFDGVTVAERDHVFTQDITANEHHLVADEPTSVGGANLGVTPYDLLLAALGACTSMTLRMYAQRKKLNVTNIQVQLQHSRIHASDCESCEDQPGMVDQIRRLIQIDGDITDAQRNRMLEIADMCPVHRTLHNQKEITSELVGHGNTPLASKVMK